MAIIKKTIFILFLIMIPIAHASIPKYEIATSFNDTVDIGNNIVAKLVFHKLNYEIEEHTITDFGNYTFQEKDKIIWAGGTTIEIHNNGETTILTPGDAYYLSHPGDYNYNNLNNSMAGVIHAKNKDDININISVDDGIINYEINNSNFTLGEQEKIVTIATNINDEIHPGQYPYSIHIFSNAGNKTYDKSITIPEIKTWNISNVNITTPYEIESGNFENIGYVNIFNNGNIDFPISTEITGNASSFIITQDEQMSFRKTNTIFNILVQVPNRQANGRYYAKIKFKGGDNENETSVQINVVDLTRPEILRITYKSDYLWKDNEIELQASDNVGLKKAVVYINDTAYDMEKDQQLFFYKTRFLNEKPYNLTFCVTDTSNNTACINTTKQFKKIDVINGTKRLTFPSKKYDVWAKANIFNLSENVPINITLVSFNYENNESEFKFRLIDGDENTINIRKNETITISHKGEIYMEIKATNITKYDGKIKIDLPEYTNGFNTIVFDGEILDYNVPDPFTREWGGGTMSCKPKNTGDLATSKVICTTTHPITADLNNMAFPMTLEERKLLDEKYNATVQHWKEVVKGRDNIISGILAVGLLTILISFYLVVVKPRMFWIRRWD